LIESTEHNRRDAMNRRFYNPSRHIVRLAGPNKETVVMKGGSYKILSEFYLKYCPKFILLEENIKAEPHPPENISMGISHKVKATREIRSPLGALPPPKRYRQQPQPQLQQKIVTTKKHTSQTKHTPWNNRHQQKMVGRPTATHIEATKLFKKHLAANQTSISNDIGIGVLSYNRLESIKRLLDSIQQHTDLSKTTVFVSDESTNQSVKEYLRSIDWIVLIDNDKRLGVAGNSNRLLRCLERFKYKILLNDDVTINQNGWDTFYVTAMEKLGYHHFCYRQSGIYGAADAAESTIKNGYRIKTIRDKPHGAVIAFDHLAFDKVGFFDVEFGLYGMEHVDWSYRIWKSGIQPSGYHDVEGSEQFFTIHDEVSAVENRFEHLATAKSLFDKVKNSRVKVDPDAESIVPFVTYVVPYREQDGRAAVYSIINNIKSQHFPAVDIILVEQSSAQTINSIAPCLYKFAHSNTPFNKAEAFNYGVASAPNGIIILHDADIMVPINYTSEVYKVLRNFKSCHIGKSVMYVNKAGTDTILASGVVSNNLDCDRVVGYFEGGSLACYKDTYIGIGGFNESFVGYGMEDCEFFERLKNNTSMYDERYVDFVHLNHGRTTGWESLHNKNIEINKKLISTPMPVRLKTLIGILKGKYSL